MKRKRWLKAEDEKLISVLETHKYDKKPNWEIISQILQTKSIFKTGKQCKERFVNNLNPSLKKEKTWRLEENKTLFELHRKLGNKWTKISKCFEGRSDNCVKNQFFLLVRKSLRNLKKLGRFEKDFFLDN